MKSLQGKEFEEWKQSNKGILIDTSLKEEYLLRLQHKSLIAGKAYSFEEQINRGSGQELKGKFWSKISSSRMAFDLYSWISTKSYCSDFQFEKKLPGIKSGCRIINSNMDVFIRTSNNNIWFIESKFTETPNNKETLPEAYYQTKDENGNVIDTDYSDCTWYYNKEKNKLIEDSLKKRFSGYTEVAKLYVPFVKEMMRKAKATDNKWFDTKQECCHLLGIIMFILREPSVTNSNIHFRNIVYGKETNFIENEPFAATFMNEASKMVNNIILLYKLQNITFDYKALTIQEFLEKHGNEKAIGYENTTVEQSIRNNFNGLF